MRLIRMAARGGAAGVALLALAACENQVPTATGSDLFPGGVAPTTLELELPASSFLLSDTVFGGYQNPRLTPYLLVANRFDGALDAHTLVRFTNFPDSVSYAVGGVSRTEAITAFASGRVVARVDSLASAPRAPTVLRLWELEQAWDSSTVTWEHAVDRPGERTPWRTPGGTRGALLAEATWVPGDTVARDTVAWQVDSAAVQRMRSADFPGLLITVGSDNARLQLSQVALVAEARPAGRPDTTIARRIAEGPQTFIFDPPPPEDAGVLSVGGLTGERSVLRLDIGQTVPLCEDPADSDCPRVPLSEVTLNRVTLVLESRAVPLGFRPLSRTAVVLRQVVEPELGRLAPLGRVLASDTIPVSAFQAPTTRSLSLDVTQAVGAALQDDVTTLAVALLADAEVREFGVLWFDRAPRLRLRYTLPLRPVLP